MLSVLVLLAAVISAGCVWNMPELEPMLVREPRPVPVPLRIGVYYSPEFRSFTYRHDFTDSGWILGEPSVRLLHEALTLLFIEVVEVPLPGSGPNLRGDLAGVIEPRIVSAAVENWLVSSAKLRLGKAGVVEPVHITYGFTVYSPSGEPVASWNVTGGADDPFGNPLAEYSMIAYSMMKRNFEYAMREAAWKLTSGFRDIPEVREWLAEQAGRKD